ncbi:MAG: S9 family peptidase [Deltaproteobacteria bacterium]|nr:S9 family peptidase [Deltaproteobacteria bacterium]MBI3390046.1 S9 family peptidase [Deltaproteobacteria bacterium]
MSSHALQPRIAPYGSWRAPITADVIVASTIALGQIAIDANDIYWTELRPTEGGRSVIVRRTPDGIIADVTPPPFNARTRVHEYGGGAFTVADGVTFFANFTDQRLYRQDRDRTPRPITPDGAFRYADAVLDRQRSRLICVREDHSLAGHEAINMLVGIDSAGRTPPALLTAGNDFYAAPRLSPDRTRLAWLTWNHPNMPWDGTELWLAKIAGDGALQHAQRIAGGADESIFQPQWSPDGTLYFVSDRSGWWNLYRWNGRDSEALCDMAAEFGRPQWAFGQSTYAFESATHIICSYAREGRWHLARLDTRSRELTPIALPYTEISSIRVAEGAGHHAVFCAGSPTEPMSIVRLDLVDGGREIIRCASTVDVDAAYFASPQPITFATTNGETAHAFFYPPRNRDYTAPDGEQPPLLVISHGGPTGAASTALNLSVQYWTSRGLAVLDVNYRGSTGYGRAYRRRLNGQWGVVDVDDCVNGACDLIEHGLVDPDRLAIRGSSAGGYTTLCALTFRNLFKAGASYYGIGDLEALAHDTHKFESRYEERLIGPYPGRRDLYHARSPIHFTDRLSCPVIFFQGLDDKVVPPNQAEAMVAALRAKHLPVAYVPFAGEGHGFRRAEHIKRALEAELYFYSRVFQFVLADAIEPVAIENL